MLEFKAVAARQWIHEKFPARIFYNKFHLIYMRTKFSLR